MRNSHGRATRWGTRRRATAPTFATGTDPWWAAGTTATVVDGKGCITVPGGTTNRWDVALGQNNISLTKGQNYQFSLFATGTPEGHVVRALVGLSVAPYDAYFEANPATSVSGTQYTDAFTASTDTTQGQVAFQVGGSADPLGRNALNQSYVSGYGEVSSHNTHSRWYARELDPTLPGPPKGTLAGGPNASIQDPYAQGQIQGCVGQMCYIDDIQSWSTNEEALNWNSALAWVASFVADQS